VLIGRGGDKEALLSFDRRTDQIQKITQEKEKRIQPPPPQSAKKKGRNARRVRGRGRKKKEIAGGAGMKQKRRKETSGRLAPKNFTGRRGASGEKILKKPDVRAVKSALQKKRKKQNHKKKNKTPAKYTTNIQSRHKKHTEWGKGGGK